jgi:hypothetical protein
MIEGSGSVPLTNRSRSGRSKTHTDSTDPDPQQWWELWWYSVYEDSFFVYLRLLFKCLMLTHRWFSTSEIQELLWESCGLFFIFVSTLADQMKIYCTQFVCFCLLLKSFEDLMACRQATRLSVYQYGLWAYVTLVLLSTRGKGVRTTIVNLGVGRQKSEDKCWWIELLLLYICTLWCQCSVIGDWKLGPSDFDAQMSGIKILKGEVHPKNVCSKNRFFLGLRQIFNW